MKPRAKHGKNTKLVTPKHERFDLLLGYFKTTTGWFKNETIRKVYDIPLGFTLIEDSTFVEDSREE